MDDKIIDWLHKEIKIGSITLTTLHFFLIIGITFAGFMTRFEMFDNISGDYHGSLSVWVAEMHNRGGLKGIAGNFYNYTPPYVIAIFLLSYLPIDLLYSIKLFSIAFDLLIAVVSAMMIYNITKSRTRAVGIYAIMLIAPTIANNSGLWAQCDGIYSAMILCSIYYLMKEKPTKAMIFYGIAFALKLQSVFVLPVYIVMWALKKIDFKHFLFIPLMYFIGILPAWIAGRPLLECLTIYVRQSEPSPFLSLSYPNIYYLIGNSAFLDEYASAGIWMTFGVLMVFMFYIAKSRVSINKIFILDMFILSSLLTMFFLPFVHERYAYLIDVLTIIFAFIYLDKFYIAIIQTLISYSAYSLVLSAFTNVPFPVYSFGSLFLILFTGFRVYIYCKEHENEVDDDLNIPAASIDKKLGRSYVN